MLIGQNLMNCAMCKYREQVLGFEAEVGLKQESHHHHVEGIGGGLEIVARCDLRICGESARFGIPVNRLGAVVAYEEMQPLLQIVGQDASEVAGISFTPAPRMKASTKTERWPSRLSSTGAPDRASARRSASVFSS